MTHSTTLKTTLFVLLLSSFISINSDGQSCLPDDIAVLQGNSATAVLPHGGSLWWDFNDAGYIVPDTPPNQVAAIFAGAIWIGGIDPAGNLQVAARAYEQGAGAGSAGPLINGAIDDATCENFDTHWRVNSVAVLEHIEDFENNGMIDNPVGEIFRWPGKGNPESLNFNGFELPDMELAPFIDKNANGIYEPMLGEYPDIKGDQAVWWIYNPGVSTSFISPKVNVSVMAYAFNDSDEIMQHATFYDIKMVNAGAEPLDSTFIGLWIDADLGCYVDDYIGCSPGHNMSYVYNEDGIDGDPQCPGIPNYGDEIPIIGFKFLKGATDKNGDDLGMSSFMYMNNAGINNPEPGTTDPETAFEVYNYLNGRWRDGVPLTVGGFGYDPGSQDVTSYAFPVNPANTNPDAWSLCTTALPSADRRALMNSGPFNLLPGESNEISLAVIYVADQPHPCPDISSLIDASELVEEFIDDLVPAEETFLPVSELSIAPNPFNNAFQIKVKNNQHLQSLELRTVDGKLLRFYDGLNTNEIIVERENLPSGIYFFKAYLENGRVATGKVVAR